MELLEHTYFYEENGILIQEVDSRHLEEGLLKTAELLAHHTPVVVLLTHYSDLLRTDHRLDYKLLSQLLGVRVGLKEDKEAVLAEPDTFRGFCTRCPGRDVAARAERHGSRTLGESG